MGRGASYSACNHTPQGFLPALSHQRYSTAADGGLLLKAGRGEHLLHSNPGHKTLLLEHTHTPHIPHRPLTRPILTYPHTLYHAHTLYIYTIYIKYHSPQIEPHIIYFPYRRVIYYPYIATHHTLYIHPTYNTTHASFTTQSSAHIYHVYISTQDKHAHKIQYHIPNTGPYTSHVIQCIHTNTFHSCHIHTTHSTYTCTAIPHVSHTYAPHIPHVSTKHRDIDTTDPRHIPHTLTHTIILIPYSLIPHTNT